MRELLQKYCKYIGPGRRISVNPHPKRLIDRHFPSLVPWKINGKKSRQRNCVVCSHSVRKEKLRSSTLYQCDVCDVGLCVIDCFKEYHLVLNY